MSKRLSRLSALLAVVLLFSLMAPAMAASKVETKTITVAFNDIKISINGQILVPKDAAGNPVEPFLYDGTTYVPVRAISQAFGKTVQWDDKEKIVSIYTGDAVTAEYTTESTAPGAIRYQDLSAEYCGIQLNIENVAVIPKDAAGNVVDPFIYNGTTYLPIRAVAGALGKTVDWDGETKTVLITDYQKPVDPDQPDNPDPSVPTGDEVYLEDLTPESYGPDDSPREIRKASSEKTWDINGKLVSRGILFCNSRMLESFEVTYNIGGGYKTFEGSVSQLWDDVDNDYNYRLKILADGEEIYSSPNIHFKSLPHRFSVDVTGCQKLTLVLEAAYGNLQGFGNNLVLPIAVIRDALLTK